MNDDLQEHRQNLAFAHETAGIRPWEWNLENNSRNYQPSSHQRSQVTQRTTIRCCINRTSR